jgi:hypothetical protein
MMTAEKNSEASMKPAAEMRQWAGRRILFPARDPIGMFVLACWGDSLLSKAIIAMGGPSHVAVGFRYAGGFTLKRAGELAVTDDAFYYEALFGKGVVGPVPINDVYGWVAKSKNGLVPTRRIEIIEIPCDPAVAALKRKVAETYVGSAGYGELQLLAMLAFIKWGWPVPHSMGRVVCSEYVARVLFPEIWVADNFDEITPRDVYEWAKRRAARATAQENA